MYSMSYRLRCYSGQRGVKAPGQLVTNGLLEQGRGINVPDIRQMDCWGVYSEVVRSMDSYQSHQSDLLDLLRTRNSNCSHSYRVKSCKWCRGLMFLLNYSLSWLFSLRTETTQETLCWLTFTSCITGYNCNWFLLGKNLTETLWDLFMNGWILPWGTQKV